MLRGIVGFLAVFTCAIFLFPAGPLDSVSTKVRDGYLRKARVWHKTDIPRMDISRGPNGLGIAPDSEVPCKYVEPAFGGTSPKFYCKLGGSEEIVRVKFHRRETYGEIAGCRLLWALGFYSDENYPVQLQCNECPEDPAEPRGKRRSYQMDDAILERNFPGEEITEFHDQGWTWKELDRVTEKSGGSKKAEVDALKLLAVFMQHTDSKHQQQRLACYNEDIQKDGSFETCSDPVLMIQDLGATFGESGKEVAADAST